ncbi:TPA: hypothetical protein ACKPXV_001400 [Pseudomonas aeruginosa]|uniref:hypothetical protein n=1 Tax=Pseudomonas aeruginosa TaxID=287 RepID=UPI0009859D68|nr:hypothetical protein [Pseudomonas aeruginosa]OOH20793.1 hypothetical protein B0B32_26140 [Pseudomonas aeruginosa]OOH38595.1 hypothetical protein B0B31_29880 [Pseudomonas aeruginosa]HEJ4022854.1 hypothetical protein [Pseudomonas aeruginosa]
MKASARKEFVVAVLPFDRLGDAESIRRVLLEGTITAEVREADIETLLTAARAAAASLRWHRDQGHFAGMDGVYLENLEAAIKGAEGGAP